MLELYTLSAPESPVRAWMRWTIGRERQTVTWMSLKEHVAHTGITLSNHVSLHVYCTWHLCHHAVPLNSMLNLSLFPWLRSLIPCHIHTLTTPHLSRLLAISANLRIQAYSKLGVRVHAKLCSVGWLARPIPNCWIIWANPEGWTNPPVEVEQWNILR